jgi:cold shock CspA family protein
MYINTEDVKTIKLALKKETKRVDFGVVERYLPDRGFGFISHTFLNDSSKEVFTFLNARSKEVFFHISKIKRKYPELAKRLNSENLTKPIYFWYEFEEPEKGDKVSLIVESKNIRQKCGDDLPVFIKRIESMWRDIDLKTPLWLDGVTIDLVGDLRRHELISERDTLKLERKNEEDRIRKEAETLQKIEEEKAERLRAEQRAQQQIEDNEFEQLVAEMTPLDFTHSSEVSSYIMRNKLGYKYKNISGVVIMEQEGRMWDFNGGFPPDIYARLCSKLNLYNEGSNARVVGFNSFKKINEQSF